ncbi:MAG: beta-galactosidase, partial [Verrucomicrobiota bacterium]
MIPLKSLRQIIRFTFYSGIFGFILGNPLFCASVGEKTFGDTFSIQGGRSAKQEMAGLKIENGPMNWMADPLMILESSGKVSTTSPRGGSVWIPLEDTPHFIRVKANLNLEGSDWGAVALGGKWGTTFHETAQLWVLLKTNSHYQIMANGGKITLKSGTIKNPSSNGNEIEIQYWKKENAVSVIINENNVLEKTSLNDKGFTPIITTSGVRFNGPIDENQKPSLNSFSVSIIPSPAVSLEFSQPLGVFAPGEKIVAKFNGRGIADNKISVKVKITDFNGTVITENSIPFDVENEKAKKDWEIPPLSKQGYFALQAECLDEQGNLFQTLKSTFAIIPEPSSLAQTESNKFGAMVFPFISYPLEDREKDAQYMQRIGLRYVRIAQLNWVKAQAAEGDAFQWDQLDPVVDIYHKYGIQIISITGWPTPRWASQGKNLDVGVDVGNFMPTEESMASVRKFCREMAARYKGKVLCYEIGNETDAYFWLGSVDHYRQHDSQGIMKDYASYFTTLLSEIQQGDPQVYVVPGTTSDLPEGHAYTPWLKTMLDLDMGKKMTGLAPHYQVNLKKVNAMLAEYKVDVPVFLTEIGGIVRGVNAKDLTMENMKEIIRGDYYQFVTQLTHKNVKVACKFLLREQSTYGGEGNISSGLLDFDFT